MDKRLYLVIIADMIGSKKIHDRSGVQRHLETILDKINITYQDAIASQFILTLGDEFQGVLCDGSVAMGLIHTIQREMHPVRFRFGIGIGTISIALQKGTSLGSDGMAFHLARERIVDVKALESKKAEAKTNMLIGIESQENTAALLNSLFKLSSALQDNWTGRQRETIATLEEHRGTQVQIAKRLGIVQSSVQKSLASSQFYAYREASDTISHALEVIMQNNPED